MAKRKNEVVPDVPCKKPGKAAASAPVAICVPLTAVSGTHARNLEQATHVVYQLARACTIFNVVEVVVLDVPEARAAEAAVLAGLLAPQKKVFDFADDAAGPACDTALPFSADAIFLSQMLQFFITPPYLVRSLFHQSPVPSTRRVAKQLCYAAKLPKLSTLPFMANNGVYRDYKEGLSVAKETPRSAGRAGKARKLAVTRYINIGEREPLELVQAQLVPVHARVTVDVKNRKVVSPQTAYGVQGALGRFGYHVRVCRRLPAVFTESAVGAQGYAECVYVDSQDYAGRGAGTDSVRNMAEYQRAGTREGTALLVLGKYSDISRVLSQDKDALGVAEAADIFDARLTVPVGMRAEDAALVALAKIC